MQLRQVRETEYIWVRIMRNFNVMFFSKELRESNNRLFLNFSSKNWKFTRLWEIIASSESDNLSLTPVHSYVDGQLSRCKEKNRKIIYRKIMQGVLCRKWWKLGHFMLVVG